MSTNGQINFIAGGIVKRSYNHWDSQPSGLGADVLDWLRGVVKDGLQDDVAQAIRDLTVVSDFGGFPPPTDEQRRALKQYEDKSVGGPDEHWYRLVRKTQGDPGKILAAGYAYDQLYGFDGTDEFWTYTVDADKQEFRVQGHSWAWEALPADDAFIEEVGP